MYRENRAIVNSTLASPANEIQGINIDPKCKENGSFEKSTLAGLTHMWVNRIMTTQPRLHELIIYDFLMRTYKSQIAQQKR